MYSALKICEGFWEDYSDNYIYCFNYYYRRTLYAASLKEMTHKQKGHCLQWDFQGENLDCI